MLYTYNIIYICICMYTTYLDICICKIYIYIHIAHIQYVNTLLIQYMNEGCLVDFRGHIPSFFPPSPREVPEPKLDLTLGQVTCRLWSCASPESHMYYIHMFTMAMAICCLLRLTRDICLYTILDHCCI